MSNDIHNKDELEKIINSYKIVLDIFKLNNDNYFKRVQVFMSALQVGVAIAFAKVIYPVPISGDRLLAAAILAVLGGIFAVVWRQLGMRQSQYLEFNRRYLRNLEIRLQNIGMPLDYFNLESKVFKKLPPRNSDDSEKSIGYATACIFKHIQTDCNYAKFKWVPEEYPETYENADKLHKIGKVKGGMVRVELDLTLGIAITWFSIAALCLARAIMWLYLPSKTVDIITLGLGVVSVIIGVIIYRRLKLTTVSKKE